MDARKRGDRFRKEPREKQREVADVLPHGAFAVERGRVEDRVRLDEHLGHFFEPAAPRIVNLVEPVGVSEVGEHSAEQDELHKQELAAKELERSRKQQREELAIAQSPDETLQQYVQRVLSTERGPVSPETPLFWSTWGRRIVGKTRAPMTGKNIWRLCKVYGRLIGYPTLKPHDLRHGVAMEVLEQHHDLEEVRALLGHARIDTTQVYASIRPPQLKRAVAFYEKKAGELLAE